MYSIRIPISSLSIIHSISIISTNVSNELIIFIVNASFLCDLFNIDNPVNINVRYGSAHPINKVNVIMLIKFSLIFRNNNIINSIIGTSVFSTISFFSCFILFTYSDNLGSSISSSISVIEYCFDKRNSSLNDSSR